VWEDEGNGRVPPPGVAEVTPHLGRLKPGMRRGGASGTMVIILGLIYARPEPAAGRAAGVAE
jgi:hypothetical protein